MGTFKRSDYMARVDAMFGGVTKHLEEIGKEFTINVITDAVLNTPGPNNQLPNTEYIATGRLRAGWNWDFDAPSSVSQMKGGPYDETGRDTAAAIASKIRSAPFQVISYAFNEVGYMFYVATGTGNHPYPRPVHLEAADRADEHARRATAEVSARHG